MSRRPSVRAGAARVIAEVLGSGRTLDRALPPVQEAYSDRRDRALLQAICYGVLRFCPRLECLLDELLDRPLKPRDVRLKALLLAGLYQVGTMDVPDHAAVAETVDAAAKLGKPGMKGLVNAVLRRYARERTRLDARVAETKAGRWAHPEWMINRLAAEWPDHWQAILAANNERPPMWLRVNRSRAERDAYIETLGRVAKAGEWAPESVLLEEAAPVEEIEGFPEGLVSVQDAAAQLAAHLLDVRPGHRVLDACAAPGGKAAHVLELCPEADLDALEMDENRLTGMRTTFARLGLGPRLIAGDASRPRDWWDERFYDRILVDAPCTASGVIRRHPDIKILRRESDIASLAPKQQRILDGVWPLLRRGGHLVYATCSVFREENEHQIAAFLEKTPDARSCCGRDVGWGTAAGPGRQILPGDADMDGFYYACLIKS